MAYAGKLGRLGGAKRRANVPVVECSCGMVMSHSVSQPRSNCIRCGSDAIREVDLPGSSLAPNQSVARVLSADDGRRSGAMQSLTVTRATVEIVVGTSASVAHEVLMNRELNN